MKYSEAGKGHDRRPRHISREEEESNFKRIFPGFVPWYERRKPIEDDMKTQHEKEVIVSPKNFQELLHEATALGPSHVAALLEMIDRQGRYAVVTLKGEPFDIIDMKEKTDATPT